MKYLAFTSNGKVIAGPWGEKPVEPEELSDDEDQEDREEAPVQELFQYESLGEVHKIILEELDVDEGAFEVFDTDEGDVHAGILIKLDDSDFAKLSLGYDPDEGLDFSIISGEVAVPEDESVGIPLFEIELGMLDDRIITVPLFIEMIASNVSINALKQVAEAGTVDVTFGSERGTLFEDEFDVDDEETQELIRETLTNGIELFEKQPWTMEMEQDFVLDLFDED